MKKLITLIIVSFCTIFAFSTDFSTDDELFFTDESFFFEEVVEEDRENSKSIYDFNIIETEKVDFGGSTSFSLDLQSMWINPFAKENTNKDYWLKGIKDTLLVPNISASLFFDARPNENLRIYGKAALAYPFEVKVGDLSIPQLHVKELFTDYNLGDQAFFRFGKHTVKWGVGYFFSPSDVINIGKINPEKPEEQVEGAISLRAMVTFPNTQNCLYLYLIPDESFLAKNTAFSGKYDFLVKNTELGLGFWTKQNRPSRIVGTLSSTLFGKVPLYGEAVLAYGTEEQWLLKTEKDLVFQGTLGFSYYFNKAKINLATQYYFNGFGDENPKSLTDESFSSKKSLYNNVGQHYFATSIVKSQLFSEKLSLSGFCLISFSDFSGIGTVTLNMNLDKNFKISLGSNLIFGKENSEFARKSNALSFNISAILGGGNF